MTFLNTSLTSIQSRIVSLFECELRHRYFQINANKTTHKLQQKHNYDLNQYISAFFTVLSYHFTLEYCFDSK